MNRTLARIPALLASLALLAACGAAQSTQPAAAPSLATVAPAQPTDAAATGAPAQPTAQPAATAAPAATEAPAATAAPAAPTAVAAPAAPAAFPPRIALQPVADGFDNPLYVTHAGDGSGRIFVVEKAGRIMIVRDGQPVEQPFLDIRDRVGSQANEQGLFSVAFHPRYRDTGLIFVNYTDRDGDTVISRFGAEGDAADPASEKILLEINQPYANHNGGLIKFGPDGMLYIGMGDGGSGGDPQGYGQNPGELLGKMLRIDVDGGDPYGIPQGNPGGALAPEIWALGLRNPWRFSFDRATGDLFIADVGQNAREEVHFTPAGAAGGINYGWNVMEGTACFRGASCDSSRFDVPVAEYTHDLGQSITGGYVYRGAAFPAMQGVYLFGDFASGRMWALRPGQPGGAWESAALLDTEMFLSSFGEDEVGELYLTSMYDGTLFRIVAE